MKVKNFIIVSLVVFAVVFGTTAAAYALSAPAPRVSPVATVSVDAGEVWIQKNGSGDWLPAGTDVSVASGDRVKTGVKSRAHLDFFSGSAARLDENTEVLVREAAIDEANGADQKVDLELITGRLWSRILKFLDQDSSYSVETSDVVATVRGTAFVIDATDPTTSVVRVVENSVQVALPNASGNGELIDAGEEAAVLHATSTAFGARRILKRKTESRILNSEWYQDNKKLDDELQSRIAARVAKNFKDLAGQLPGSPLYGLKILGEKLRLSLASSGAARRELALRFADRRFAEIATMAVSGRKDVALRYVVDLDRRYLKLLAEIKDNRLADGEKNDLCKKLRGRFLEQDLAVRDGRFVDLEGVFDRLPDPAGDVSALPRTLRDALCLKTNDLRLPAGLPEVVPVGVGESAGTSTNVVGSNQNANSPIAPARNVNSPINLPVNVNVNTNANSPSVATPVSLAVTGLRTLLYVPDMQQLAATLKMSDGTSKNITDLAVWSSSNSSVLTVQNGLVSTVAIGSAAVSAAYGGLTGNFSLRVLGPQPASSPTAQTLSVVCSPNVLTRSTNVPTSNCTATVHYSDNSTKDATYTAVYSATLGTMSRNIFTVTGGPGVAVVSASYADPTGTVSGKASITIN